LRYCTVSVSVSVAVVSPAPVADTVNIEVTGLVLPPPPPPPLLPLPHPFAAVNSATAAIASAIVIRRLRCQPMGSISNTAASGISPRPISPLIAAAALLVCTVTLTVNGGVAGVTLTGDGTVQVSPDGAPVHEKLTVPV
jgi:hypothetical protein